MSLPSCFLTVLSALWKTGVAVTEQLGDFMTDTLRVFESLFGLDLGSRWLDTSRRFAAHVDINVSDLPRTG